MTLDRKKVGLLVVMSSVPVGRDDPANAALLERRARNSTELQAEIWISERSLRRLVVPCVNELEEV